MSNYYITARNKETGDIVEFEAMDNYYGKHQYGYVPVGWPAIRDIGAHTQEQFDEQYEMVKPTETHTMKTVEEKLPIEVRTWIRDYWYSLQDIAQLPESKRVELEQLIRTTLTAVAEEARAEAESECFESRKILWERMKEWNDEWRAENPEDRALCTEDAMRLIEWKIEKAREEARREAITEDTSDGKHTFKELYDFRLLYNAHLFNEWYAQGKYNVHKSQRHYTGELCFGRDDYFVVVATLPTGQISNHYPMSDWELFKCEAVEKAKAEWDGHTSQDVARRLREHLTNFDGYDAGRLAEIEANATADITIAKEKVEQIRKEARREERANLVEWMTCVEGVYSAHDVRMSFLSLISALNDREDNTK